MRYFGALQGGGTKMVLSRIDDHGNIMSRHVLPTLSPAETIPEMIHYFRVNPVDALGIACFGPVDLNVNHPTYGYITATPKPGWQMTPIVSAFQTALNIPIGFDTDVNAAALAEATLGAAKDLSSCLYVTVGTGIGGGLILHGQPVHGMMHPEIGHQLLRPSPADPCPDGFCPFHPACLEGLAAGPSIEKRWHTRAENLPEDHPAWALEADYLSQMCHNAIMSFSPQKIILGGGVMKQRHLFPLIRKKTLSLLAGYISSDEVSSGLTDYIVPPGLGENSGVLGAYLLAKKALEEK